MDTVVIECYESFSRFSVLDSFFSVTLRPNAGHGLLILEIF